METVPSCPACGSCDIRRAKLRVPDVFSLLRRCYPVRCRTCRTRSYSDLHSAMRLDPFYHYRGLGDAPETFWSRLLRSHPLYRAQSGQVPSSALQAADQMDPDRDSSHSVLAGVTSGKSVDSPRKVA